ncbi:MAG TPA: DNA glycosylase [Verrucomicrobiae bacterium]|nr:DNA glycosylase [Verrucomicrobiae bacterium]
MRQEHREVGITGGDPTVGDAAASSSSSFSSSIVLPVCDYDLAATLDSGQVFRWQELQGGWSGVIGKHRVWLTRVREGIRAETVAPVKDWDWLREFLQTEIDWAAILETFPDDAPMRAAVAACHGLRVLRQDPWECLASFILSSTKQIVQIRQIISLLCERFGEPFIWHQVGRAVPCAPRTTPGSQQPCDGAHGVTRPTMKFLEGDEMKGAQFSFPTPQQIAAATESELRACKMGFRAPYLLAAARQIAGGKFDLHRPRLLPLPAARAELMKLRGVGGKIADCVLLFAYGFDGAFPVDVWVERALRQLYFPRRRVTAKRLRHFAATHFGSHAGCAQQYLFHYMRTKMP